MLTVTRQGRDLRCRAKRVARACECRDCGKTLYVGDRHIVQGVASGGRGNRRRFCGDCAIERGVALVVLP